ncbi:DUF4157 domain-containing protein [Telmatobacter bradus]|uniref:eCIS core domain-containing protein n=1 Tax=Telmatobacter bradus TaxID=474953 RepID=UPI003B43074F
MQAVSQQVANKKKTATTAQRASRSTAAVPSFLADSPRITAQRQQIGSAFGSALQAKPKEKPKQLMENAETLQAKPKEKPKQRKASEDTLQAKPKEKPKQLMAASQVLQAQGEGQSAARKNNTGLPDNLKSGIESLSGMSMDSVRVHYNSAQPAQLNALAYAQGADIHVAPGQEQHLPHEAWHVVQQAQGRVQPTMQMKGGVPVNDDRGLEHEADGMGAKAMQRATVESNAHMHKSQVSIKHAQNVNPSFAGQGAVQLTAWMKQGEEWKRKKQTKFGDSINWERDTSGENTPPASSIGENGWVYSSNRIKYFTKYSDYRNEVLLDRPSKDSGEIETTSVGSEEKFLKGSKEKLKFKKDVTHNYLLWSVPKYTGKQMLREPEGKGMHLADVSGEAKAEQKANRGKGYMMKQTLEHFEALTALKANLGNESDLKSRVVSQYGKRIPPSQYDPKKVDALHYPRDPQYQSDLIDTLKKIDSFWDVDQAARGNKIAEINKTITEAASARLATEITRLLKVHQGDQKRKNRNKKESEPSSGRAFNKQFYGSGFPQRLMQSIKAKKGLDGAIGDRDGTEEVTRAPLVDRTKRDKKSGELIGGRNAVFETIWGPKSTKVVNKAAMRKDAVVSHGLKYHFSPANTVQAKYEFPPYKVLVETTLDWIKNEGTKQEMKYYKKAIEALNKILDNIAGLNAKTQKDSLKTLGEKRAPKIKEIQNSNNDLVIAMANLRGELLKGQQK